MTSSKVSVAVPVFNGEQFVGAALASLRRGQEEAEIVVVDDGLLDGSVGAVRALAEQGPRIRLITGAHRGVAATESIGVRTAMGDYITFFDCNDICAPGRIARQLRLGSRSASGRGLLHIINPRRQSSN